jgi:curved DNA-binding protein
MHDHYKTLGLSSAATREEIRRAYRILARRYHPDVNPGKATDEKFRQISEAYEVLSDPERRKQYDDERNVQESFSSAFDKAHQAYRKQQAAAKPHARPKPPPQPKPQPKPQQRPQPSPQPPPEPKVAKVSLKPKPSRLSALKKSLESSISRAKNILAKPPPPKAPRPTLSSLALMEVSISVFEAIAGVRKTVEVVEKDGELKKVSVAIPAGVRQGSIVRMRSKDSSEEIIIVIRVAHHPWLSITHRGLTLDVPITVSEALSGAKIQVPSLGDPLLVTVEPGAQSGTEVRLKGQGIAFADGTRGDLFLRFLIKVPSVTGTPESPKTLEELDALYGTSIRAHLPRSIMDAQES